MELRWARERAGRPDALIIGAGHNGLVAAWALARAGLRPLLLEQAGVVGGCAVTEEFAPGFRNSVASYTVSLLHPRIIAEMGLEARGLRIVPRPLSNALPTGDGRVLEVGGGLARTQAAFARFSPRDAARLPAYFDMVGHAADVVRDLALAIPPEAGGGWREVWRLWRAARPVTALGLEAQRDLLALFAGSARDLLEHWFETPVIQAAFGFDAVVGNYSATDTPGSAYVLLHHLFGEVNGARGQWGHALGGMGAITAAMANAARAAGATIRCNAPVARVRVDGGRVAGVALEDGEEIACPLVVANVGPKLLWLKLVDAGDAPSHVRDRIARFKTGSGSFRMNLALSALPRFAGIDPQSEAMRAGLVLAPSLDWMDDAYADARQRGWARRPVIEALIPSLVDPSLAPAGGHVMSLFCQHFQSALPDGRSWDEAEAEAVRDILDTLEQFAPGVRRLIVGQQVLSPLGLERRFGLTDGDIFHGRMTPDQLWAARPILGMASYRTPIEGLWMCGAGTHPGGGVTGACGHNAARAILSARRRR